MDKFSNVFPVYEKQVAYWRVYVTELFSNVIFRETDTEIS